MYCCLQHSMSRKNPYNTNGFQCIAIQWFEQKSEINVYRMASVISLRFGCCQTALPTGGRALSESFTLERLCACFVTDLVRCLL